jgi:hypothetical protein
MPIRTAIVNRSTRVDFLPEQEPAAQVKMSRTRSYYLVTNAIDAHGNESRRAAAAGALDTTGPLYRLKSWVRALGEIASRAGPAHHSKR